MLQILIPVEVLYHLGKVVKEGLEVALLVGHIQAAVAVVMQVEVHIKADHMELEEVVAEVGLR